MTINDDGSDDADNDDDDDGSQVLPVFKMAVSERIPK